MLILVGLTVTFFTAAFIIIDPPPYPYFDWEPYFDQAYEEDGCEGAAEIVWMSLSSIKGPDVRFAQMVLDGECPQSLLGDRYPETIFEYFEPEKEPNDRWQNHLRHYVSFTFNRIFNTVYSTRRSLEMLDTPSRRAMWPSMISIPLNCPSSSDRARYIYQFRHRVAQRYNESLLDPYWERLNDECADMTVSIANIFEETEIAPPSDRMGERLNSLIAWLVLEGAEEFNSDELSRIHLRWSLNGTAAWNGPLLTGKWCAADWAEYALSYNAIARSNAHRRLLRAIEQSLDNANWWYPAAIAELHRTGHLLPQSNSWAYYWHLRAADNGSPNLQGYEEILVQLSTLEMQNLEEQIQSGIIPPNRPAELSYIIRSRYYQTLEAQGDDLTATFLPQFREEWLTAEDRQIVESLIGNDQQQERPSDWPSQNHAPLIALVNCETGERAHWQN